jgi:alpha-beta hydrolase superfamily lysophospholipase
VSVRETRRFFSGFESAGAANALTTAAGRPVVVMAHGLAGTKDSGLEPFAARLAQAGLDVLAFDNRGFGASDGSPRQRLSMQAQLEDYRAAMAAAAGLPGNEWFEPAVEHRVGPRPRHLAPASPAMDQNENTF